MTELTRQSSFRFMAQNGRGVKKKFIFFVTNWGKVQITDWRLDKDMKLFSRYVAVLTRLIASFGWRQKGRTGASLRKKDDPFKSVIGLMSIGNLINAETTIDRVVSPS